MIELGLGSGSAIAAIAGYAVAGDRGYYSRSVDLANLVSKIVGDV